MNTGTKVVMALKESKTKDGKTVYRGGKISKDKKEVIFATYGTIQNPTEKQKAKGQDRYLILELKKNEQSNGSYF